MSAHDSLPEGRLKRAERWLARHELRLLRAGFLVMFIVALVTAYFGWRAQRDRDHDFREFLSQSAERRDQSCRADEREHLANVNALRQTYRILASPAERAKLGDGLTQVVVLFTLPQLERKARHDQAPDFCDMPGVGLPEPDPKVPKRRDFGFLLHPANPPP